MATIAISDLRPVGSDLFIDSENYLQELSERELSSNKGGHPVLIASIVVTLISIGYSVYRIVTE